MNHLGTIHSARSRRGLVSVAMLIGLIILAMVAASLLKVGLARRTRATIEERQLQADALADSGLDRALARLATAPAYEGEVWEIPTEELGGRGTAKVTIKAPRSPDDSPRSVQVVADYQASATALIRQSRSLRFPSNPPNPR